MTDYKRSAEAILYDLIEESNPGFQASHPLADLVFGVPTAISTPTGSIVNTSVLIKGKPGSQTVDKRTVTYRRINMASLFRNVGPGGVVRVTKYLAATQLPIAELPKLLLDQYGLNIPLANLSGATSIGVGGANNYQVINHLCFTGTITLAWAKGPQILSDLFGSDLSLAGRRYPTKLVDVGDTTKPQGEFLAYNADLSKVSGTLNAITSGVPQGTSGGITSIVAEINAQVPEAAVTTQAAEAARGIGGAKVIWTRYILPHADVPEADPAFARVVVIQSQADSWFQGRILLHYN